jgi:hypothetical protein
MNKAKLPLIIAAVLLGIPILSCGGCLMLGALITAIDPPIDQPVVKIEPTDELLASPSPPPAQLSRVTKENFGRIQTGMNYAQVVSILGEPSEQLSEVEIAGQRSAMFQWNADNWVGNMNITFSNGAVMSKAQFGLP